METEAVDTHAAPLLPHAVRGVFVNYVDHDRPHLFARPTSPSTTIPKIDDLMTFVPEQFKSWWSILDHCNGLLLCRINWGHDLLVCNPATRQWTLLPWQGGTEGHKYAGAYLAFDPAVSSHYEVFLIPEVPEKPPPPDRRKAEEARRALRRQQEKDAPFCLDWFFSLPDGAALSAEIEAAGDELGQLPSVLEDREPDDDPCRLMEWPPATWILQVFSSRTGQWVERAFVREGEPAGLVEDMRLEPSVLTFYGPRQRYAVYIQGALYVHCRGSFVARFSFSDDKYQVFKVPANIEYAKPYLGRSEKGVYFGITDECKLLVWILNESCRHMDWVLKCEADLTPYAKYVGKYSRQMDGAWIVKEQCTDDDDAGTIAKEISEWDSDSDDVFEVQDGVEYYVNRFDIFGFHPDKEVVFLVEHFGVLAYHLNSSKVQYLGHARPESYYHNHTNGVFESFVYTPCMIGQLDGGNTGKR
ncbi:hypothetical protein ACP70R_009304 [Stipagrostis hirtigluma subsp. patula]